MASSNVTNVTNHFPTVNEGFTATLGGTISAGASVLTLSTATGLTDGSVFVGMIEPTTVKEQVFTGTVDVGGLQVTGVKWTRGTNVGHDVGSTIVDIVTGTAINMISKGIQEEHNQDGTHSVVTATSVTATTGTFTNLTISGSASAEGWSPLGATPNTVTANGNRSYSLVFNGNDLTDTISEGMRVRTARTVAAPVQCTSLNGTTQYYSKASPNKMTFTDDFVVSAWVKLSSYATSGIVSRYNGTSGWQLVLNSAGQIQLSGFNAGGANESKVLSYQSLPLNKWVHITAQLDMSAFTTHNLTPNTSYIMIDGVDVPVSVARTGTNPTALIQAGNLEIGSTNGGTNPFPGKIAQVAIYNAKVTQATILASMNQGLIGTETSLASAYSFNNSITDLNTTTPNDLTANGSAVATNADSPFGNSGVSTTIDYGIVMAKAFSTNTTLTIQVPEGCTIPTSGGVSSMDYSINAVPYGFPGVDTSVYALKASNFSTTLGTPDQITGLSVTVKSPVVGRRLRITLWVDNIQNSSAVTNTDLSIHLGTVSAATQLAKTRGSSAGTNYTLPATCIVYYTPTSTSDLTFNAGLSNNGAATSTTAASVTSMSILTAEYVLPL